ncbi:MAG: DUF4198 domain-containing protein [Acidimicrobiia bacterium]|nr:DUF4198 domain-containing protein [Acidimicrobiia bacterium]
MNVKAVIVAAALALSAAPLAAHDMWIEPSTFFPQAGALVGVGFRVGENLLGDRMPRDPALVNEFVVEDAEGRKPVVGRTGSDPAGLVRAGTPGLLVVGYRSNPSAVEQTNEKFTQYLKEEGLEAIAQARARRGQTGPVRELFSRSAKSLIQSGPVKPADGDRVLGFPIELVAERNPYAMSAGQELPVRLTYENGPLAGALVVAVNRANPMQKLRARSGKDGRVRFTLPYTGVWLVKAVHMVEAPAGANAEWVSYWASLTFELP